MSDQDDSQSGRDAKGLAGVTAPDDSPSGRGAKVLAAMTEPAEELKAEELAMWRSVHRIRVRCGRFERNAAQMSPDEVLKKLRQKEFEANVLREQHLRNCQLESLQQASSPMTCGTMPRAAAGEHVDNMSGCAWRRSVYTTIATCRVHPAARRHCERLALFGNHANAETAVSALGEICLIWQPCEC